MLKKYLLELERLLQSPDTAPDIKKEIVELIKSSANNLNG
jgi:hypothetical protein